MSAPASGEELLRAFDRFPVAGALLDPDGGVDFGNEAFARRFGPEGLRTESRRAAAAAAAESAGSRATRPPTSSRVPGTAGTSSA